MVNVNGNRYYGVRVEGAKDGVGFGSALAIAISYTENHSILWGIIDGILGWLFVIYFALFRRNRWLISTRAFDDPILLPDGRTLVTLKDAADFIIGLPKREHDAPQ